MNQKDFISAYEPIPQALEVRVQHTLAHLEDERTPARGRFSLRTAVILLALLLALCGIAYAAYESVTAHWFGWFYGKDVEEDIQQGDIATMGQSYRLGDVVYTVEEMVYKATGDIPGLYGVVRAAPAEGANVVLVPEDLSVGDPAGYLLHYSNAQQTITDDAASYAELAQASGGTMITPLVDVGSLMVSGQDYSGCYGKASLSQTDGSVLITIEMTDGTPRAESYALTLSLCNQTLSASGRPKRDEQGNRYDWELVITPEMKEEQP